MLYQNIPNYNYCSSTESTAVPRVLPNNDKIFEQHNDCTTQLTIQDDVSPKRIVACVRLVSG